MIRHGSTVLFALAATACSTGTNLYDPGFQVNGYTQATSGVSNNQSNDHYRGNVNQTSPESYSRRISSETTVEYDSFKNTTKFSGPLDDAGTDGASLILRGWQIGEKWDYQVYVLAVFSDWAHLSTGWRDGQSKELTQINRDVKCRRYGCTHFETVGYSLTNEDIAAARRDDLRFKVSGTGGERVITLSSNYVEGVMRRVESETSISASLLSSAQHLD